MQQDEKLDCIAKAVVLNDAADLLAHRENADKREESASEWLQAYLRSAASMWIKFVADC